MNSELVSKQELDNFDNPVLVLGEHKDTYKALLIFQTGESISTIRHHASNITNLYQLNHMIEFHSRYYSIAMSGLEVFKVTKFVDSFVYRSGSFGLDVYNHETGKVSLIHNDHYGFERLV